MHWFPTDKSGYGWLALGLLLFLLVAGEAARVPVTHDEVNTIALSQAPVWDIVTYKDPIPNNHILNTLLIKAEMAVFGKGLFVSRLHNLLAFLPFFLFAVALAKRLFADTWMQFTLVGLVCLQPYMLDFFSVARGYGLSVAFEVGSLYFLVRRIQDGGHRAFVASLVLGAVGVYANFTLLNFFFPLLFVLAVDSWTRHWKSKPALWWRDVAIATSISGVLGVLSFLPFFRMMETKQFVYWGTAGFLEDTARPLIYAMRSGTEYFHWSNEVVYVIVMGLIVFLVGSGIFLWRWMEDKKQTWVFFGLLGLTLIYNHMQFWVMDVPFLNARTALFFIPLVSVCMVLGLSAWVRVKPVTGYVLVMLVSVLSIQHFVRGYNGKSIYEWYYDENTYDVIRDITYMIETEKLTKPVKLNCHWIFYPSLSYHVARQCPDAVELVPYHKELQKDSDAFFYYTQVEELEALQDKYNVSREYGWRSRLLLRKK